jgi:hypothetical protein
LTKVLNGYINCKGVIEMKKTLFFVSFLMLSSLCFAVDYYAEYSFAEVGEIDKAEIHGGNGWEYNFVFYWTKADIQQEIIKRNSHPVGHFKRTAADYMNRMLRASADKRIFIIDTSVEFGPYGWLFIKINENEYVVFFTGN